MQFMKRAGLVLLLALAFALGAAEKVKYVFLFIGDGMSMPQRMLAEDFLFKAGQGKLLINHFPFQAPTTTRSANSLITDSAASGTAIACGEKTDNGRIGMDSKAAQKFTSIAEIARDRGRKVGIVSSVTINHATPASFYGHRPSRGDYYEIGIDLVDSGFDYFGGGGAAKADDKKSKGYKGNLYDLAGKQGYKVVADRAGFDALVPGGGKVWARGADDALPYAIDRTGGEVTLADFTRKGIELLDNPNGFFMMVEGGKIDWMCHANDAGTVLRETFDFNDAVKVACDFAAKHPDDTLIVVTGDHETGGLTLGFVGTGYTSKVDLLANQKCSLDEFKSRVSKAKASSFDELKPLIAECFGLHFDAAKKDDLYVKPEEEAALRAAFDRKALPMAVVRLFDNKASLGWTSSAHTALPVVTSATGKKADLFQGMIDNTDIPKKLETVL